MRSYSAQRSLQIRRRRRGSSLPSPVTRDARLTMADFARELGAVRDDAELERLGRNWVLGECIPVAEDGTVSAADAKLYFDWLENRKEFRPHPFAARGGKGWLEQ